MTTQNIMPVYVQLILSLLDNQKFPLFKAFCLEYNQDNHINWNFEAEWQFETKDTLKQFLLNRFPNFSQELINFYHEQNIPFVLNNSKNAKALLEQNQKQLLLNVITQQKLLNQELTIFSLNHLSLDEIIQCENTGIDFYINSLYPYLHVNGDKQKFNYFIEKKKINYHISFFKDFFNLYQQYKNDNSKHYYTQKENVFKKIMQTIIDKIIEHDLFKNDFSKMSYFSSFDELENFIDDIQNADFSLYNDSLIKHIAKHNLYNPDIISKQKLVKLINNFRSYIIEPFFQEAIKDQPFEVAFDYIEYLTIQPNNTPSFYFMYNNQNVRMIKDFPLEEKEKVVKQIINNFIPKDEEKRYIGPNNELAQGFIINLIKSSHFKQSDFSEQIFSMINKYKLKDNNYDDTNLIYNLYELYCSKYSNLNDREKNIIQNLVCTRHILGSAQVIEDIIRKNKNQHEKMNQELLFVKNFSQTYLTAIYNNLFGDNNQTLSRINEPECKTLFENFIISSNCSTINEDNIIVKKRL